MKIVQKGTFTGDILETVLNNRKIENRDLFLNPIEALETDPLDFTRTDEARSMLFGHLAANSKIAIVVDADADGFTSAAILYNYIQDIDPNANLEYIVQHVKTHGLTKEVMEEIDEIEPNLVLIPDAGSNDVDQLEKLYAKGIEAVILDHHHVTEHSEKAIVVNNQLCPMTNDNLVGAGVVYKFIQGIDEMYGHDFSQYYLDLVAVGQIGDSSDIANPEIRKLVMLGLTNINNPFLKVAMNQQLGFKTTIAPKDLSFTVIPLINAVSRVGTLEERQLLFEALVGIGEDRIFKVVKRRKNKSTGKFDQVPMEWSLYEYAYDMMTKVKNRQAAVVKKILPSVESSVQNDLGIAIAVTPEDTPGISGLVANKLVSKYDKPALLLNKKEDCYRGSGRGHEKTIQDFRQWCEDSNLVEFAQGHAGAFGIGIHESQFEAFKEYAKNIAVRELVYEVDHLTTKPDKKHCEEIDDNKHLFGGAVHDPLIGIVGLTVPRRFISFQGSTLKIFSWGVQMIKFGCDMSVTDQFGTDDVVTLNIVGTYNMNEWSGQKAAQLIIKDFEVVSNDEVTVDNIIM